MNEQLKPNLLNSNSNKIKEIAQVLSALSYLNSMMKSDTHQDVSDLLDSTYKILNITYNNLKKIQIIEETSLYAQDRSEIN